MDSMQLKILWQLVQSPALTLNHLFKSTLEKQETFAQLTVIAKDKEQNVQTKFA